MRSKKPVEEFLFCLAEEDGEPPPTHLFHRGDHRQPKEAVTAAMLEIATPPGQRVEFPVNDGSINSTGRRLAFAITSRQGRRSAVAARAGEQALVAPLRPGVWSTRRAILANSANARRIRSCWIGWQRKS